jgi:peptidoglycan/LPS O-acetylase OafA/YrhL
MVVTSQRNNLIDLLRFLAAIAVVLHHFYYQVNSKPNNIYTDLAFTYGKLGVPMFFIISGYCIMIALSHSTNSVQFIIRRLFRIFPPYWFSLIITGLLILILKLLRGANSVAAVPKTIHDIFYTVCLLTYPITKVNAINWVYWTLPYEVLFYGVIFIYSFAKDNYFTLLLILLTIGSCMVPPTDTGILSFFKYWPLFGVGAALFKLLHDPKSKQAANIILFTLCAISFYTAHLNLAYCIISGITIILILISHFKPLRNNRISKLGDYSYSIYLIHVPLAVYSFGLYRELPPLSENAMLNPLLDLLLLIMVVFLSKAMYKYIELPSINFGRRLSKSIASRHTTQAFSHGL